MNEGNTDLEEKSEEEIELSMEAFLNAMSPLTSYEERLLHAEAEKQFNG
jgi:hypothetical protein